MFSFKNRLLILCLSTAALCCFISCDKDKDDDPKPKTKLELLQQKWDLVASYDTSICTAGLCGPNTFTEYTGKPEDYFTFGQNDTLVRSWNGIFKKDFYKFDDSTMTVSYSDGRLFYRIWDLTDSTLELYYRFNRNARGDSYTSSHVILKR